MDLETWLSRLLEGKKLQIAVTKCENAVIESLADLVDLYESGGKAELETVFPKMLAVKIDNALAKLANDGGLEGLTTDQGKDQISAAPSQSSIEQKVVITTQSSVDESANTTNKELPAGKR